MCDTPWVRSVEFAEPSTQSGGRRFVPVAEVDLHAHVGHVAATLPGRPSHVLVVPEMPSPLGLPDFVALVGGCDWLSRRRDLGVPPILSEADASVLASLNSGRALSRSSVAHKLAWSEERVDSVLRRLVKSGSVQETRGGAFKRMHELEPDGVLIAIEAKVRDWRKAVQQGRAYRTWANNYVVLLGEVGIVAAERASAEIGKDRAGLVIADEWIIRPKAREVSANRRLLGFEHLYAALTSDPTLGMHEEFEA